MTNSIYPVKEPPTELLEQGRVYLEIFPMKVIPLDEENRTESRLVEPGETPDFYDIVLRPEDWDMSHGKPYGEWEDMSEDETQEQVIALQAQYPGVVVCDL